MIFKFQDITNDIGFAKESRDFLEKQSKQNINKITKKIRYYQSGFSIYEMQKSNYLEKFRYKNEIIYELKLHLSPPYRILGFMYGVFYPLLWIKKEGGGNKIKSSDKEKALNRLKTIKQEINICL